MEAIAKRPAKIIKNHDKQHPFRTLNMILPSSGVYDVFLRLFSAALCSDFEGPMLPRRATLPWRESLFIQGFMAPKYLSSSF